MSSKNIKTIGTVIPIGDGATGKSLLIKHLINPPVDLEASLKSAKNIKKSLNVEIKFSTRTIKLNDFVVDATIQYYVFPGQRQKTTRLTPTFDDIVNIFEFLPALKKVTVLLMIYDASNIESLKSLENWLISAIDRGWLWEKTKIILVANKIDIKVPNDSFISNVTKGILTMLKSKNFFLEKKQIVQMNVSSITLEGMDELRDEIFYWVALHGLKRENSYKEDE